MIFKPNESDILSPLIQLFIAENFTFLVVDIRSWNFDEREMKQLMLTVPHETISDFHTQLSHALRSEPSWYVTKSNCCVIYFFSTSYKFSSNNSLFNRR